MTQPISWSELGVFPLQDHDPNEPIIEMREMLVGGRVGELSNDDGLMVWAKDDDGLGTLGDLHPWKFWQTLNRKERAMGSWSPIFAAGVAAGGGGAVITPRDPATDGDDDGDEAESSECDRVPSGGSVSLKPIRKDDLGVDPRYAAVKHTLPRGFPKIPGGALMASVAGTEEREQHDIALHCDPRLIAVNKNPSADMGTLVADLDPQDEIGLHRMARLQTAWRVLLMPEELEGMNVECGNGIAWQLTASKQDTLAGFGLCYGLGNTGKSGGGQGPLEKAENLDRAYTGPGTVP